MIEKYKRKEDQSSIIQMYIKNIRRVNNWDLVDATCDKILGKFLLDKKQQRKILYELAKSPNLWEKRISIVTTFAFIRENDFGDTLKIAQIHLQDKHDLMHKAVGWMLREVGNRNIDILKDFLKTNYKKLPRTTLRYAIEKFPEEERKNWLKGEFN